MILFLMLLIDGIIILLMIFDILFCFVLFCFVPFLKKHNDFLLFDFYFILSLLYPIHCVICVFLSILSAFYVYYKQIYI